MIERLLIAVLLLLAGYAAYQAHITFQKRRIAQGAQGDPILASIIPGAAVIVYFTTPTCIPCKTQQMPALTQLQNEMGERLQIVQIDATTDSAAADRWGVLSAPTTFVLDGQRRPHAINHGVAQADMLRRQVLAAMGQTA